MNLAKAMATVGGLTMISRIAGFIRDVLTAAVLGAGPIADAFFVALKLPNFLRRVTAEGAFSFAFIPLYTATHEKEGSEKAKEFSSQALTTMLLILFPFTLLMMWLMPSVVSLIAPGFVDDPVRFSLAVDMARITFPFLIAVSVVALMGGMLNAHDRFAPMATASIFFNLSLITVLLFFENEFETVGHGLSWAVSIAGILQILWMIYCFRKNKLSIGLTINFWGDKVKRLFRLMGPSVLGAGITQVNLFIDIVLASLLPIGSISFLYYADRLNQLPLGVVGVAIGTALLPMLTRALNKGDGKSALNLFNRSVEFCFLLAFPAAIALAVIPFDLVSVLFERGSFGEVERNATAVTLQAYAIGLPAYVLIKVFNTLYFSRQDTKTPVKVSIVATVINIGLSLFLIQYLSQVGIALATGISGWIHIVILGLLSRTKGYAVFDKECVKNVAKIVFASILMAVMLFAMSQYLFNVTETLNLFVKIFQLAMMVISSMILYGAILWFSGVVTKEQIKHYFIKES